MSSIPRVLVRVKMLISDVADMADQYESADDIYLHLSIGLARLLEARDRFEKAAEKRLEYLRAIEMDQDKIEEEYRGRQD